MTLLAGARWRVPPFGRVRILRHQGQDGGPSSQPPRLVMLVRVLPLMRAKVSDPRAPGLRRARHPEEPSGDPWERMWDPALDALTGPQCAVPALLAGALRRSAIGRRSVAPDRSKADRQTEKDANDEPNATGGHSGHRARRHGGRRRHVSCFIAPWVASMPAVVAVWAAWFPMREFSREAFRCPCCSPCRRGCSHRWTPMSPVGPPPQQPVPETTRRKTRSAAGCPVPAATEWLIGPLLAAR